MSEQHKKNEKNFLIQGSILATVSYTHLRAHET